MSQGGGADRRSSVPPLTAGGGFAGGSLMVCTAPPPLTHSSLLEISKFKHETRFTIHSFCSLGPSLNFISDFTDFVTRK